MYKLTIFHIPKARHHRYTCVLRLNLARLSSYDLESESMIDLKLINIACMA